MPGAGLVLIRREYASQLRLYSQHREQIGSGTFAFQFLRILALAAQVVNLLRGGGDILKDLGLCFPVGVVAGCWSVAREPYAAGVFIHRDQAIGIAKRERAQQHRVHDTEDCRSGADPEHQREQRRRRESGTLGQHPQAISNILKEGAHNRSFKCSPAATLIAAESAGCARPLFAIGIGCPLLVR